MNLCCSVGLGHIALLFFIVIFTQPHLPRLYCTSKNSLLLPQYFLLPTSHLGQYYVWPGNTRASVSCNSLGTIGRNTRLIINTFFNGVDGAL